MMTQCPQQGPAMCGTIKRIHLQNFTSHALFTIDLGEIDFISGLNGSMYDAGLTPKPQDRSALPAPFLVAGASCPAQPRANTHAWHHFSPHPSMGMAQYFGLLTSVPSFPFVSCQTHAGGKSAILTAITVALGGKPRDTGRGMAYRDLIRTGESYGTPVFFTHLEPPKKISIPSILGPCLLLNNATFGWQPARVLVFCGACTKHVWLVDR
jgi:hypothetical protein